MVLTFGSHLCLRKKGKEHGNIQLINAQSPIMPLIAIIMTATLIWGTYICANAELNLCVCGRSFRTSSIYYGIEKIKKKVHNISLKC